MCASQLLASVDAPTLAAQPLPIEEVRACEVGPESRAPQVVDGFAVQGLRGLIPAQQRARSGVDPAPPIAVAVHCLLVEAHETTLSELGVSRPGGSFDQLAQRPHGDMELRHILARLGGRRQRLLVSAKAVHENGSGPMSVLDGRPLADGGGIRDDAVNQLGSLGLAPADARERKRSVWRDAGAGRLLDGLDLGYQQRGTLEVAAEGGGLTVRIVRDGEGLERPGIASELDD